MASNKTPFPHNRAAILLALIAFPALAQTPPPAPGAVRRPGAPRNAFPQRAPAEPAVVDRGKALYGVHCNFCHGSDARGGEGGPNLLRSDLVLNDQNGELIGPSSAMAAKACRNST